MFRNNIRKKNSTLLQKIHKTLPSTVNCRLYALGFDDLVRGFRRAYKWRGLYWRGFTGIEKSAIAVLIKIRFAFIGFQLSFEMSK